MKAIELNNIEENKFVLGYVHYKNNKNKIVYKKALGYIVPEENLIFCMSSHDFQIGNVAIEELAYEKSDENDRLYASLSNNTVFEYKKHIYPESNNKISMKELMELTPLLEKYMLDEDFELDEKSVINYKMDSCVSSRKEVKKMILKKVSV